MMTALFMGSTLKYFLSHVSERPTIHERNTRQVGKMNTYIERAINMHKFFQKSHVLMLLIFPSWANLWCWAVLDLLEEITSMIHAVM